MPGLFKYKLDCYVGALSTHGFFTGITLAAKRIYYRETGQGRDRLVQLEQAVYKATERTPGGNNRIRPATALSFGAAHRKKSFKFWQTYMREFSKSAPAALAGAFVHVLSQLKIMERGGFVVACFIAASVVFKILIQESTKRYIIKKKIQSVRFMCAAVGLPTVLIDTQTRIILLGTMNTKFVVAGTIGMGVAEIFLRVGKAYITMRTIHNRDAQVPIQRESVAAMIRQPQPSSSPARTEFELWRRRVHAYHIAEITADTYAEYIAIGCSASILFFFGDHPYYSLLRQASGNEQRWTRLKMLAFQAIIEVVVGFVSTVLEMVVGLEFDITKGLGFFLIVLFMLSAVLNINISVGIYLF
ncbi:hypothetical protein PF002_g5748 [Phytophthora fragariae]|uniref:Uncharacterized protein n=1 Tax=Phytophthora fragariae TaxID=53985 RepID=A0A6A3M8X3_9STRA|nr:hypothetical protein PF003_g29433 [Phytophthora fragariae]KAE8944965.1 hypothetical protein PF009_g5371 [Phytophthora fragariae]KAE9028721.1 hypothetical protein PF011_g1436 [Phytophthora fragariae]KAE9151471.1 hypothetical protein PF006_g4227 [Phytophthora fragariae]KAE9236389.1 hypothetical protein PF004_g8868 [Phytophthora fragariae]